MNTCNFCGNTVSGDAKFCPACGATIAPSPKQMEQQTQVVQQKGATQYSTPINNQVVNNNGGTGKTAGTSIAALVCACVGLIVAPLIMGILGVSLGATGLNHIKTFPNDKGKGLAIAGIVIGIIDIIWYFIYVTAHIN